MDYAKDLHSGKVVTAEAASPTRSYACPRPGCGGRVYLPDVVVQRPHFRHYPGEGTLACDRYFPSASGGDGEPLSSAAVEDDASELGLLLTQVDSRWGLGLRLPEIPSEELGETSLNALRSALVDVYSGSGGPQHISALELRPGVGAARVDVAPTLELFRTEPAGSWPSTVHRERWRLESRGLGAKGVLFRLCRGEWTRLVANSGVRLGEKLLVLAEATCAPPTVSTAHAHLLGDSMRWCVWEVEIPGEPSDKVRAWLAQLGHHLVPRPWSVDLATPPRAYSEAGEPVFWLGDSPVLTLEAPRSAVAATIALETDSNSCRADVVASQSRVAHVGIKVQDVSLARLAVAGEPSAILDVAFRQRPSRNDLLAQLALTPRLRVQIGEQALEAWRGASHRVSVPRRGALEVRVDLGDETARARVTTWERGKRRTERGLNARRLETAIKEALASAERVEVEAGNLGRVVLFPVHAAPDSARAATACDRLAWREHVMSVCPGGEERSTPILVGQPRAARSLAVRQVAPAVLIRARLAVRRRLDTRGDRL